MIIHAANPGMIFMIQLVGIVLADDGDGDGEPLQTSCSLPACVNREWVCMKAFKTLLHLQTVPR